MKSMINFKKHFRCPKKQRGQVFILATLIIVVYTISMIAVVTELSVDRTQTDQIDLPHMVNEYLSEMNYQLQLTLYKYIINASFTSDDMISSLQSFISVFSLYATSKGVGASINLRLNEFSFSANKTGAAQGATFSPNFNQTTFISVNSSILFQSSDSGSKITGIFNHYYGVNLFVSSTNNNVLMVTQRDSIGNVLNYISRISFTSPLNMVNNNNGNYTYTGSLSGVPLNMTLPTGLILVSR